MEVKILENEFAICKISDIKEIDFSDEYCFIGKTDEELSLVCSIDCLPNDCLECDKGWKGFRIEGKLDFSLVGILSQITGILAEAQIGIYAVSTYNTDYIFTKEEHFQRALEMLKLYGYSINTTKPVIIRDTSAGNRSTALIENLLKIWEKSVWATHAFLSKEDIRELKPFVLTSLEEIPRLYILTDSNGVSLGFAGMKENKLEMLFLDPDWRGCGYGRQMMEYLFSNDHLTFVDVNEQNPLAAGFYRHMGFEEYDRNEYDGQGKERPIIKMKIQEDKTR